MRPFLRTLFAACVLALPGATFAQNRAWFPIPAASVRDSLGVNIHFTDAKPGEMDLLRDAGFRWIRMDLGWAGIEREKGKYDFSAYDRLMADLKAHGGIRPILILDYGNDLYEKGSPRSPEARAAFARFAAAVVTHFKNQGVLWEMWNEPNIGFWQPKPNADEYIALALEVGKAIRAAAPEEYYIGAGTSGMDFGFLEKCFRAGLLTYWDAVSFHPYRNDAPETAAPDFQRVREMMAKYAPKGKKIPLISSEWGYSELYSGLNLEKQSKYVVREFLSNMRNDVRVSIWYDWHDDGTDAKETEHHFGTVFHDYKPKPTYQAIQTLSQTLDGYHFNKRLALASPDDYCLLFSNAKNEAKFVVWTTSATPHVVVLPMLRDRIEVVDYLGVRVNLPAHEGGLPLVVTDAPQYLAFPNVPEFACLAALLWHTLPPYIAANDAEDAVKQLSALMTGDWRPSDYPISAQVTLEVLTPDGKPAKASTVEFPVYTQKEKRPALTLPFAFNPHDATPTRLRATFRLPGMSGSFAQETLIVPKRPLHVTILPANDTNLAVRVENPSGEPFSGVVDVNHVGIVRGKNPGLPRQDIRFAAGETDKTVTFRLPAPPDKDYKIQATLYAPQKPGGNGKVAVQTPMLQFTRLKSFANLTNGDALPANAYTLEADGDPKVKSENSAVISRSPEGFANSKEETVRISYDFDAGWKFLRLNPQGEKRTPFAGKPSQMGMRVYSDGAGGILRMRFTDATGQTFQPGAEPGDRLDWTGWRYVTFDLTGRHAGHWGGANDGAVHYPIHLDTLLLIDSPEQKPIRGTIYVEGVTLVTPVEK